MRYSRSKIFNRRNFIIYKKSIVNAKYTENSAVIYNEIFKDIANFILLSSILFFFLDFYSNSLKTAGFNFNIQLTQ